MPRFEIDLNPVSHIAADAIGAPGQRVFYLQAWRDEQIVTLLIEKIQLQSIAIGVEQLLAEIARQNPELPQASADYVEDKMHIYPPLDPLFRVGEIGLGYDAERDLVVLVIGELLPETADAEAETGDPGVARFWCTRAQARALAQWSQEVIGRGRPLCPQCGEPMDAEGHFCPKKNGHKRQ